LGSLLLPTLDLHQGELQWLPDTVSFAFAYPVPRLVRPISQTESPALSAEAGLHWEIEAKDGLPSADRNNKATLLLTGPFRTAKSSAKDLTPLVLKLQYAKYRDALPAPRRIRLLRR
jgi:hypothetical protein